MTDVIKTSERVHVRTVNGRQVRVHTEHVCPPIPVRSHDWSAVTDDYDCDCDQDGFYSLDPVGTGPTEEAAIADLLEQLEEIHECG